MEPKDPASQEQLGLDSQGAPRAAEHQPTSLASDFKDKLEAFAPIIDDEILRYKIRKIVDEKPKDSWLKGLPRHPLISIVVASLLSVGVGAVLTDYYSNKQMELTARQSFSDELNKIRVQKVGEVWERLDEDELAIDTLLDETTQEELTHSDANDKRLLEIRKLIHADRTIVSKNRFWLGEEPYGKVGDYLDKSIKYAVNYLMGSGDGELKELRRQREAAKQDILQIRYLFLESPQYSYAGK